MVRASRDRTADEPETELPDDSPLNACYELRTTYQLTGSGQLGRALSRQISQAEAENANCEWIEERLSEGLREDIASALEDQHA